MNTERDTNWYELVLLALVALCLLLALLELWSVAYDPRFTETPANVDAVQVDSVRTPPPKIARHCVGDWGSIEREVR